MHDTIWIPIPGTDGYEANASGEIRRYWILKPWRTAGGAAKRNGQKQREIIRVRMNGTYKRGCYVHRLVASAFYGPCPDNKEVNHIDGNPLNNRADNLEYVTRSGNLKHAWATGLRNFKPKTHCINGHKFTKANTRRTFMPENGRFRRICRACTRDVKRRQARRRKHEQRS